MTFARTSNSGAELASALPCCCNNVVDWVFVLLRCRLLDVCPGNRTLHEMQLYLVFEHIDQDLAHYLEKCPAPGLGPDRIRVRKPFLSRSLGSSITRYVERGSSVVEGQTSNREIPGSNRPFAIVSKFGHFFLSATPQFTHAQFTHAPV